MSHSRQFLTLLFLSILSSFFCLNAQAQETTVAQPENVVTTTTTTSNDGTVSKVVETHPVITTVPAAKEVISTPQ